LQGQHGTRTRQGTEFCEEKFCEEIRLDIRRY
jgi:hypothetical protein